MPLREGRALGPTGMIYRFEEFELDTDTFELRDGGAVVHVEPQVFGVLAHLIDHHDRVVSKVELLDEVWPDRFVSESALTSRIQAARRACRDSGREQRIIRTQHGRGYRFVADVEVDDGAGTARTVAPSLPSRAETCLVGRDAQLELLDRIVAETGAGQRSTVLLGGPAGFGKTTLVESALERAGAGGPLVIRSHARALLGVPEPYVSLLEALGRLGREQGSRVVDVIDRVAPMWMMQLPSLVDEDRLDLLEQRTLGGTPTRMLREGVDLFEELGRQAPLILVAEDLHWADPHTLDVVEWISTSRVPTAPSIVATYRTGAPTLDPMIGRLTGAPHVVDIELPALERTDIQLLARDRLEAESLDDELLNVLAEHSGGNPLFAVEELDLWLRDGHVVVAEGHVRPLTDAVRLRDAVPDGVRHVIQSGLERLGDDRLRVLRVAAVIGRRFPAFLVAAGLGEEVGAVEERLVAAARGEHLIDAVGDEIWPDGTVSTVFEFHHELHQQLLRDGIPTSQAARIHQTVGERLESALAHRADEHVATLARHFIAAGDSGRAVDYLHRSGVQALARSAHVEAADALRRAVELLGNLPEGERRDLLEIEIRSSLGPALIATMGWHPPELLENYRRALDLCAMADSPSSRYAVRYGLASVHELRGEYNRSEELLREQIADGPGLGLETRELLACSLFHQGSYEPSLEHAVAALDSWDQIEHSRFMARYGEHPGVSCNTWGALSAWHLGAASTAMEMAERALEWGAGHHYALATARVQAAFLQQYRGDRVRCREMGELTIEVADHEGFPFRSAQARVLMAWCDVVDGLHPVDVLAASIEGYRTLGARMDEPYFLGLLADAALTSDDPTTTLDVLDEADRLIDQTTRSFFHEPELLRLRGVAEANLDRGDAAVGHLRSAAERARADRAVPVELRIALTMVDLGIDVDASVGRVGHLVASYPDEQSFADLDAGRQLLAAIGTQDEGRSDGPALPDRPG